MPKTNRMFDSLGPGQAEPSPQKSGREAGMFDQLGMESGPEMFKNRREAGLEPNPLDQTGASSKEEIAAKQQRVRDIVAQKNAGEEVSDDDKRLVFEVVFDVIKGMSGEREKKINQSEENLRGQDSPQGPPAGMTQF